MKQEGQFLEEQSQPGQDDIAPEVVERAKSMGWIPKEEFRGDTSKWRPANEYVERAETLMPILKSQLGKYEEKTSRYESEISQLKSTLESQRKTTEKILKMSESVRQQEYERARKDLVRQQAQAVSDGDVETWQKLEDQKEQLQKPESIQPEETAAPAAPAMGNQVFNQWHTKNDWYAKDQDLTIFADGFANTLKTQNPNLPYEQVLAQVESKVKEVFNHKFTNPNRNGSSAINEGGNPPAGGGGNKKTYNNLPAEAKAMCDSFIAQGIIKTREQYVKDYFELEA